MTAITDDKKRIIQEQLDRILASAAFSGSERHRRFLRFVVEQALAGETDKLNEFVLGFEVFDKKDSFDPRIDSIVRVEARRLRERLKKYYGEEGRNDPLVITLRPRSFAPEFEEASAHVETLKSRFLSRRIVFGALAVLVLGGAITAGVVMLRKRSSRTEAPRPASVIVLPFQSLSPQSEQELLGDAVADSIITGLTGIPGLRVISRASGRQVQESGRSPYEYAAELNVDYIIEGTVRATGSKIVISAKMTDTRTQSYVWAETRETDRDSFTGLERELARAVASRIRVPMPAGGRLIRRAATPEAYGAFLQGQYYWYEWERGSVEKSIAAFEKCIAGDPNYAPAWAWLAQSYQLLIMRSDGRDAAIIAKGRKAAMKALELDDQLGEAQAAVGTYEALDWNWASAQQKFRRAIELNPDWAQGHLMYALMYLVPTGQLREALGEVLRAHELDPLTRTTRSILTEVQYFNREYTRVIPESAEPSKSVPRRGPGERAYLLSLSLTGQGRRALSEMSSSEAKIPDQSPAFGVYGYLLARHGDSGQARAILNRLRQQSAKSYVSPLSMAMISLGLGDTDETFRQLRASVARHQPAVVMLAADPVFDPLRQDARYRELLRQMGLSL